MNGGITPADEESADISSESFFLGKIHGVNMIPGQEEEDLTMSTGEKVKMFENGYILFIAFIVLSVIYLGAFIYLMIFDVSYMFILGALPFLIFSLISLIRKRIRVWELDLKFGEIKYFIVLGVFLMISALLVMAAFT